jgi:hypothetical protein
MNRVDKIIKERVRTKLNVWAENEREGKEERSGVYEEIDNMF